MDEPARLLRLPDSDTCPAADGEQFLVGHHVFESTLHKDHRVPGVDIQRFTGRDHFKGMLLFQLLDLHERLGQIPAEAVVIQYHEVLHMVLVFFDEFFEGDVIGTVKGVTFLAVVDKHFHYAHIVTGTVFPYVLFLGGQRPFGLVFTADPHIADCVHNSFNLKIYGLLILRLIRTGLLNDDLNDQLCY